MSVSSRSSNFKKNAMTFAAGAAGAAAAYSIMRSLTRSHRYRSGGHYGQGYGGLFTSLSSVLSFAKPFLVTPFRWGNLCES